MKTNRLKGFIVPVLIAIIAVFIIGGGVYIYTNKKAEAPVVVDSNQSATTTDVTKDWKTYTNDKYGFELKYPGDWKILQTWRPKIDGLDGVILGYRGEGDFIGINVDIILDKSILDELSDIVIKKLFERDGVTYLLFPNNISNDDFNRIISTLKFTK